jgi:hypothetical protein
MTDVDAGLEVEGLATQLAGDLSSADGPQSPLEALRAKRDQIEAHREVLIPIIGYEEMGLKVKYRLVDRGETNAIAKRNKTLQKDQGEFMFMVLVDTIILACEGFYLAPDGVPDEKAELLMNEAKTDPILTYAQMAQELKGEPLGSQRQAVAYVFGDNEFAVGQHALLLNRWLGNTNLDIDLEAMEG